MFSGFLIPGFYAYIYESSSLKPFPVAGFKRINFLILIQVFVFTISPIPAGQDNWVANYQYE
jgi:hypothetical protein